MYSAAQFPVTASKPVPSLGWMGSPQISNFVEMERMVVRISPLLPKIEKSDDQKSCEWLYTSRPDQQHA